MKIPVHMMLPSGPCDRCTVPAWSSGLMAGFLPTSDIVHAMATAKLGELQTFAAGLRKVGGTYLSAILKAVRQAIKDRTRAQRRLDREIETAQRAEDVALKAEAYRRHEIALLASEDGDIVISEVIEVPVGLEGAASWLWGSA